MLATFPLRLLLAVCLLTAPSCDRVKDSLAKARERAAAKKAAGNGTASAPAVGLMPIVQDLDSSGYDAFRSSAGRLMVVDFHADWCGPCRELGPVLEDAATGFEGKVAIGKVNVDHVKDVARDAGVSSIPDVRLFRDGKEVDRFVGAVGRAEVERLFRKHTEGLAVPVAEGEAGADGTGEKKEPAIQPMKKDWMPPGMERR